MIPPKKLFCAALILALTNTISATWIDSLSEVTTAKGWDKDEIEKVFYTTIIQSKKHIKELKKLKNSEPSYFVRKELKDQIAQERSRLKLYTKALENIESFDDSPAKQKQLLTALRELCTLNAEIETLQDEQTKRDEKHASDLRIQANKLKSKIKEHMGLYTIDA